jgi:hypothetical protein
MDSFTINFNHVLSIMTALLVSVLQILVSVVLSRNVELAMK